MRIFQRVRPENERNHVRDIKILNSNSSKNQMLFEHHYTAIRQYTLATIERPEKDTPGWRCV